MKAFLMAAGLGTRLEPLTRNVPKCLVPIDGKPLLRIWLELCQRNGIKEIIINTHYLSDKVDAFIANIKNYGINIKVKASYEKRLLGSAGTIYANRAFIQREEYFFILYADTLTNISLRDILKYHKRHNGILTMGLYKTKKPKSCGIAEIDEQGKIVSFEEKPKNPKSNFAAAGIYVASLRVLEYFPPEECWISNKTLDLGYDIFPLLVKDTYGYIIEKYVLDIGDNRSYMKAQKEWPRINREEVSEKQILYKKRLI